MFMQTLEVACHVNGSVRLDCICFIVLYATLGTLCRPGKVSKTPAVT